MKINEVVVKEAGFLRGLATSLIPKSVSDYDKLRIANQQSPDAGKLRKHPGYQLQKQFSEWDKNPQLKASIDKVINIAKQNNNEISIDDINRMFGSVVTEADSKEDYPPLVQYVIEKLTQQGIKVTTPTKDSQKIAPIKPISKPLSAFKGVLPSKVELVNRNPMVINYQNNDYHYDYKDGVWKNTAGKVPPPIVQDLLAQWGVAIDKFDPMPDNNTATTANDSEPEVFKSNRIVAKVNSSAGLAVKNTDGKWHVNNVPVTKPEDIAKLDQEARATGQIK